MAVKFKIDDEADIPEAMKDEYEERDGAWYLKVDGIEDTAALKANNARLLAEKKKLQEKQDAADAKAEAEAREALKLKGDYDALEKSWDDKYKRDIKALKDKADAADRRIKQAALNAKATELAAKVSTSPTLLLPYVKSRLRVELNDDGEPVVNVVDGEGRPSAFSMADLEKEVVANKEFAPIIRASNATGGGAGSGSSGGSGNNGGAGSGDKAKSVFEMTFAEKQEWLKRDPAGFRAATADAQKTL